MTDFTDADERLLLAHVERIERDVSEGRLALDDVPQLLANLEAEFSVRGYQKGSATRCFWHRMRGRALSAATSLLATPASPPSPPSSATMRSGPGKIYDWSWMFGGGSEFKSPPWGDIW